MIDEIIRSELFKKMGGEKHLYQKSINEKLASSPFLKIYHIDDHKNLVIELLPFYIAFIFLNFIILLLSLCLFEKLLIHLKAERFVIHFLSLFIACSGIVKAFFFSAHEQMFVFFTPICISYIIYLYLNDRIQQKQLLLISFGMGILCLAYGSFILYFPCLGMAYLIKQRSFRITPSLIKDLAPSAIVFVIPTFSWIFICTHYSGHYFNGEISTFREFIWIKDALSIGFFHFLYVCLDFTFRFLNTVMLTLIPFFTAIYLLNKRSKNNTVEIQQKEYYQFLKWMFALFFSFFLVLGYYNFRLTYTCVPILLIFISMKLQHLLNNNFIDRTMLYKRFRILSIVWVIWSVFKYGPFPFQ